jgi:hypothetical protein
MSLFSPLGVLRLTLLSTRRRCVVALVHEVRYELRRGVDGKVDPVGDAGAELRGRNPKVLRSRVRIDVSSRFGFNEGRINVGRIGMEFGVGVGERRDGSDVDATLHRDASPAANPEGYTLISSSVEAGKGAGSEEGIKGVSLRGGVRSAGVGVLGEGGGDVFEDETYIACRTEGAKVDSTVESVVEIEG